MQQPTPPILHNNSNQQTVYEFSLSPQELSQRLLSLGLKPKDVINYRLSLDFITLESADNDTNPAIRDSYNKLLQSLGNLVSASDWERFCSSLNQLLRYWLDCYIAGLNIQHGLALALSIKLKSLFQTKKTKLFQQLFIGLIVEVTTQFDQYQLEAVKNHHQLTGLPNLHLLLKQLEQSLPNSEHGLGLLLLNFKMASSFADGIKTASPELIHELVKLLRNNLSQHHLLFQIDTFEFAVIVPHLDKVEKLDLLAAKLRRPFELTMHISQQLVSISPTIAGIYRTTGWHDVHEIYTQAKLTLDDALRNGRPFASYTEEINQRILQQSQLKQEILDAFENDRFELYFQPIVDVADETCNSAESLLRCKNTQGEFIYPPAVIDVIYQQGLGRLFLRWLLNTVCRQAANMQHILGRNIRITVNLTADDLIDTELADLLEQCLTLWKVEAQYITLEITENGLLLDEETANKTIQKMTDMGCMIALDDFGTGYSSMTRLRSMPIDLVKIDQSFVRDIANSSEDFEIVRAITMLAHGLGKQVIAEGVEMPECLDMLKKLQCEKIQGYFYSKPLSYDNFVAWVAQFQKNS